MLASFCAKFRECRADFLGCHMLRRSLSYNSENLVTFWLYTLMCKFDLTKQTGTVLCGLQLSMYLFHQMLIIGGIDSNWDSFVWFTAQHVFVSSDANHRRY